MGLAGMRHDACLERQQKFKAFDFRGHGFFSGSIGELAAFLLLFLALGAVYAWAIPYFQSSDETSHFDLIKRLASDIQLPVITEFRYYAAEDHQPPVYYVLAALVGRILSNSPLSEHFGKMPVIFFGARGLSILFGLGTVVGAYLLATHFFPTRRLLRTSATGIVVFNPSIIAISGAVTNDSAATMLGVFLLLATAKAALAQRLSIVSLLGIGVLAGLASLTKENLLYLLFPLGISLAIMSLRSDSAGYRLQVLAAVLLPALAISAWWYARNWMLYGDPLAWNVNALLSPGNVHKEAPGLPSYIAVSKDLAQTYWVGFGKALEVRAPLPVYYALWLGCGIALIGIVRYIRSEIRSGSLLSGLNLSLGLFAVNIGFAWLADFSYNRAFVGAGSGRYFFTVAGAIAILLTLGLSRITRSRSSWPATAFLLFLLVLAVVSPSLFLSPLRVAPEMVSEAQLKAEAQPVDATFDGSMQLVGYRILDQQIKPGDNLRVSLYWKAIADTTMNWTGYIHIVDNQNTRRGQFDSIPMDGAYPTLFWKRGEIWRQDVEVPLDSDAHNGLHRLEVGFYSLQTGQGASVSAQGRQWVGGITFGRFRVVAPQNTPERANPLSVGFQGGVCLVGWELNGSRVTLYWQTASPISKDLTVFVHYLNQQSQVVAQNDSQPAEGSMPTYVWLPGETVADEHPVKAPPGTYTLEVGLYDSATTERVPLLAGGDSAILGRAHVP